jgi:hypothetical protein
MCILEALEPRLLLSGADYWPVISETATDHSSEATAQNVTAQMTELFAGEGSYGVVIEGDSEGGYDYYRIDAAFDGLVYALVEPVIPGEGRNLDAIITGSSWNSVNSDGELFSSYVQSGASSYVGVKRDGSTNIDYSITLTITKAETVELVNPAYAPEKSVWDSIVTLEEGDPVDVFIMPDGGGIFRTEFSVDTPVNTYLSSSYTNMPDGIDMIRFVREYQYEAEAPGYIYLYRPGSGDLGEPNDTSAEAIDITDQLRDAPSWHEFADRIIHINPTQQDGTPDWYKVTLDQRYVERNNRLRDINSNLVYGVLAPGTYYYPSDSELLLEFQEYDDGGVSFVQIEPGVWKASVHPDYPDELILSIPLPADGNVLLDGPYCSRFIFNPVGDILGDFFIPDPGYAYIEPGSVLFPESNPVEIYAYEITPEIGESTTAGTATDINFMQAWGNPEFLVGFPQVNRTVGQEDYFRFTIPWTADLSYSGGGKIYNSAGDQVSSGLVDAGVYYLWFAEATYDYQTRSGVSIRRFLELGDGESIESAIDLDTHLSSMLNGRYLAGTVRKDWAWYSFSVQQGQSVSLGIIYNAAGTRIDGDNILVPADTRYYTRGYYLADYGLSIDSPRDITASVIASLAADGAWVSGAENIPQVRYSECNVLRFTLDDPAALLGGELYDSTGQKRSAGALFPGTYYVRTDDSLPEVNLLSYSDAIDLDGLLVEQEPGVWSATTDEFTSAMLTLTVSEGQKFYINKHGGSGVLDVRNSQGLAGVLMSGESYYMLAPDVYTIYAHANPGQTRYLSVTVRQGQEAVLTSADIGDDLLRIELEGPDWSYFRAVEPGRIYSYSSGSVFISQTGFKWNTASFDAGDFLWVKGGQFVVDYSTRADLAGPNDTQADAINISSLWRPEPEGAEILFLAGQFDNTTGEEWYRVDLAEGDCIFAYNEAGASHSYLSVRVFNGNGNTVPWRWECASEPTTYFFRVTSNVPAGDSGYGFYLHRVRNSRKGQARFEDPLVLLDDLYAPGQDVEFIAVSGGFQISTLTSDMGYWTEAFPLTSLLWTDEPSSGTTNVRPASSSSGFGVSDGPGRVVIHFVETDETELNDTIETAQDMTSLLVQDGDTGIAHFTGAAPREDEDWFKFQIDDYSTVLIETPVPESQSASSYFEPGVEIYDARGVWVADSFDEHLSPGEFFVRLRPQDSPYGSQYPEMYELVVTITPGTPWPGDGNGTKDTATSLNHLLDGQVHSLEDIITRSSDVDWYVFEPEETPYVVSATRTSPYLSLDVYYEYGGQLFLHNDSGYTDSVYPPYVVDTVPLYLRMALLGGPLDGGIEIQQVTPTIVEFVPSQADSNVSTFHTSEPNVEIMFLLPAGSALNFDYSGGDLRIRYAQPLELMDGYPIDLREGETLYAYRDMYVMCIGYDSSFPQLDMTITQGWKIEISDMVNLGAPGQGHYEFSIDVDVSQPGRQYFYLDHPAGSTSTFENCRPEDTLGSQWPGLAHVVYVDVPDSPEPMKLEGELWIGDEIESNDDLASAQRIDEMWRSWMSTGQQLDLFGWVAEDESDPADIFVFHLDAGEAVYLDPNRSSDGVLSGTGLVDNGAGVYLAVESGDVYLSGLDGDNYHNGEYRITMYRGTGVPANTEFSDAYDITAEISAGDVTIVSNARYVTFLCEPGRVYATTMKATVYSETGEAIFQHSSSAPAIFTCDNRDQVVLDIGGDSYHDIRGDIMDVTDRVVDLDSLFVPDPGQNSRSLSASVAPGDYISFTADPNEVLAWDIVSDIPKPAGALNPAVRITRTDGGRADRFYVEGEYASAHLGGGGRVLGYVFGYGEMTLTMTLIQTEPIANNTSSAAIDLTDQLAPCDPEWYHDNAGSHNYVIYEGVLSSADPVDWISVDLAADQYVTVRMSTWAYGNTTWSPDYPPVCLISASYEGGAIAGSRNEDHPRRFYDSMSKIAHQAKTQRIQISRTYDTTIQYRMIVSVRDVLPVPMEDMDSGDYYGEVDIEIREYATEWDGQIYRVDVPADSIMISSGAKRLIDVHNRTIGGSGVATTEPETVYFALWPNYFWDSSNHEHRTLAVDIHPLWTIIPDVIQTIDYTLGDIEHLQGAFTAQQETWWQFDAAAGRIVTLGRPDGATLAEQTELILVRSSGVAKPWNVTPEEDPALFDDAQRYQTLQSGTYYVMATPSILSDGLSYDWQLLVQVAGDIEPNDTMPTATNLDGLFEADTNGRETVSLTGTFEDSADNDWYKATVDAGDFLYADVTWEGGYWSNLPLEIYGPDGLLIWSDSEKGGVDRMIYAAQGGNYWIRTAGVGMAYSLEIVHGDTTPTSLVEGPQRIDPPEGYDMWMARLDLPDRTALDADWRHTHDSAGHLINASAADWIGLPHGDSYYIACYDGPLDAGVRFADANVADKDNHTVAGADSLDSLFAVRAGNTAAEAHVLGLYGPAGTTDYYKVSLAAGEALTGGAIGHMEWDSLQKRWVSTYLEMKITWDGAEMAFPRNSAFVADHAGQAVISVRSLIEWDEYRLGLVKMSPGDVGDHAGPELIGGSMGRTEMDLVAGYGANADGPMTIYDADYNFIGRIESGSWYAPRDGRYHMFSAAAPVAVDPQLRPRQVVYVNFAGGLVGQIPELFVDMGTLEAFDAGRFDLAAQQDQLQNLIVSKLRGKFDAFGIEFVLARPESLPFSKLYYTDSTLGSQFGLAMSDGVNADMFDDAYVFAGNILNPGHGLDGAMSLDPAQRTEMLATALANVGAAEVGRLLGALAVNDTADLMALEQWNDLSTAMAFSSETKSVRGMPILQNAAYAIGQGLDAHTPGVRIELGDNDTAANATHIDIRPSDAHGPTLLGGLTPSDTDFFSFELTRSSYITWSISASLGSIHMRLLDAGLNLVLDDVDRDGRISGMLDAGLYYIQLTADAWPSAAPEITDPAAAPAPAPSPVESIDYVLVMEPPSGSAAVVARRLFYNNSVFDGFDASAGADDDNAIAAGKQALLPGQIFRPANSTSYNLGINGVMIDIEDLAGQPDSSDFVFAMGSDPARSTWTTAPAPQSITVRPGQGSGGSDRVTIIWADGAIGDNWLEVTVRADGNIGLESDDVFYFGNLSGDADGDMIVGESDYDVLISEFGLQGDDLASDINNDGQVGLDDFAITRLCFDNVLGAPPVLAGDIDSSGVVDEDDYEALFGQFGMSGENLSGDLDGDGWVGLSDFVAIRDNFGNTLPQAPIPAPAPDAPAALGSNVETDSPLIDGDDANGSLAVAAESAPAVDLLVESPLPSDYISRPQAVRAGASPAPQFAATSQYDLRPLSDELQADDSGDLLVDVLAESTLSGPL